MTTFTEQLKQDLQHTQVDILKQTGITDMDYAQLMFDIGCRFIDQFALQYVTQRDTVRQGLLHDREWGFWNWWRLKWGLDDTALLQYHLADKLSSLDNYPELKEAMVGEPLLQKELYHHINDKI